MTSIEKKMIITMVAMIALIIGCCAYVQTTISEEFGECNGLEGAVNKVWTGEACAQKD